MRNQISATLQRVKSRAPVSISELEDLLISTYRFLDSTNEDDYNLCIAAICHVADQNISDRMVQQLLHDNIIKSRIFLYTALLEKRNPDFLPLASLQDNFLQSLYTSATTGTTLTAPQKKVFDAFQKKRRLIVSAPTSFGKTRIVREIIEHNNFQNIAIILPTVSLLSEQYQELKANLNGYIISKSSRVTIDETKRYILILTPERMSAFFSENPKFKFDFFVMDEIYKIDYKLEDDRFRVFSDVLFRLASSRADFYLIGPYIDDFSRNFRKLFDASFLQQRVEIVQKDYYEFGIAHKGIHNIDGQNVRIIGDKQKNLTRIISAVDGKFLIYRYQKQFVEESANRLSMHQPESEIDENLIRYLSNTVSPDWTLIKCLKRGVAFHHGAMPRHIQDLVVDEFNSSEAGGIKYLFCTTSLTEGINTSAKNVVLYDEKIGDNSQLGYLDRRNIEGRAGRFMRHFIGRVFHLEEVPPSSETTIVEIESLDSATPSNEAIIQIDGEMLSEAGQEKKTKLRKALAEQDIPLEIIQLNKFVSVEGQIRLLDELRNGKLLTDCYFSTQLPALPVMSTILSCIYCQLFSEKDIGRNFSNDVGKSILLQLTNYYLYHKPSFAQLLNDRAVIFMRANVDTRIRFVFDLVSRYFEFVWPRYLMAFQNLYNFVATERNKPLISLELAIAQLEYGTTKSHEIILRDCGLPNDAIRKISNLFSECKNFEDVQKVKKSRRSAISGLIDPIEMKILDKYI